jgi:dGTPase
MVRDLIEGARARLEELAPASPHGIRSAGTPVVAFSPRLAAGLADLRGFLRERVYRHYKVSRMTLKARRVVRELADALLAAPECLPDGWRDRAGPPGSAATAAIVRDYIAGMTDRFALDEHDRLFKLSRERA